MQQISIKDPSDVNDNNKASCLFETKLKVKAKRLHLEPHEVTSLINAAKKDKHGQRNALMIMMAYRHGLRANELCEMTWDQIDFHGKSIMVKRNKNSTDSTHPLGKDELVLLGKLYRKERHNNYIFSVHIGSPINRRHFYRIVANAGKKAGLQIAAHPHMLRHACGFKLANDGADTRRLQHYLGHKNIRHTVHYTAMSKTVFKDFWKD